MPKFKEANEGDFARVVTTDLPSAKGSGRWPVPKESDLPTIFLTSSNSYEVKVIHPVPKNIGARRLRSFFSGEISYDDVPPFFIAESLKEIAGNGLFTLGRVFPDEDGQVQLMEEANKVLREGKMIVVLPQQDSYYRWLDLFEVGGKNRVNLETSVGSYRVDEVNLKLEMRKWYGPRKQLFLDYLSGRVVSLSSLKEFDSKVSPNGNLVIGMAGKEVVQIPRLGDYSGQKVNCRPIYDSDLDYTWLEGYTEKDNGIEVQIFNRRFYKGDSTLHAWRGREMQSLIDWIEGSKPFDLAQQVKFNIDERGHIPLLQTPNVYIRFQLTNLTIEGYDQAILIPEKRGGVDCVGIYGVDQLGNLSSSPAYLYEVTRDSRSKLHSFISQGGEAYKQRKSRQYWSNPDNVRKEAKEFYDQTGELSQKVLSRERRSDLIGGVRLYPGGMIGLKKDIGISDQKIYRSNLQGQEVLDSLRIFSSEIKSRILDGFAEFIEENPETQISLIEFATQYLEKEGVS